jgi:rod shape-determining protein MreC
MSGLTTTRRNAFLLVVLLFLQLLLMSGSAKSTDGATQLESWWMRLSSPIVGVAELIGGAIHGSVSGTRDVFTARSRNAELEAELEELHFELERLHEAELENERLRRLLVMRDSLAPTAIGASVIGAVSTDNTRMIVIDRGARHGVRRDLPVVAWGGAVGRVVATGNSHSKVRLLNDPNSGVAGVLQRSRAQGMVVGQGEGPLGMLYVPRFADVAHGDRVVASGLDGIFPRGFGIGRVISINEAPDGSRTIRLAPDLDYHEIEEVLILLEPWGSELLAPDAPEEES